MEKTENLTHIDVHQKHYSFIFQFIDEYMEHNNYTDLCFICAKGRKIYTNKLFICSASVTLKKIILDMPQTTEMINIHLPDVKASSLNYIIQFLTKGNLQLSKDQFTDFQDVMQLLGIFLNDMDHCYCEIDFYLLNHLDCSPSSNEKFHLNPKCIDNALYINILHH
uniref:BTB domain-containing protein n=2 Tax=Clastoptera arizonana TaxID=38151 RepID=A0A1B6D0M6_9HEMI